MLSGKIDMDRNDIPIKDVASDEDVIMNLCWENKQYHSTLFDLYTIVRNLKLDEEIFDKSNLSITRFVEVMNDAKQLLKEENRN